LVSSIFYSHLSCLAQLNHIRYEPVQVGKIYDDKPNANNLIKRRLTRRIARISFDYLPVPGWLIMSDRAHQVKSSNLLRDT
jgi:hypothetical protein